MAKVSVIMSAYNAESTIYDSIQSILNQTFKDFDLIIIDDGSTDKTKEIVDNFLDNRIIFIQQENQGPAIARNLGISRSLSKYIAILDADDIALPSRLHKQVNFLEQNPEYVLVGSNAIIIDVDKEYIFTSTMPISWDDIKLRFPYTSFYHSSVMFRTDAYKLSGGYNIKDQLYIFEDTLLWNEMRHLGKMANIKEPLIKYRILPNSVSTKSGKEARLVNRIFYQTVQEKKLKKANSEVLFKIRNNIDFVEREKTYHLYLAKKFLFNNFAPVKSRKHLTAAIKIKPYNPQLYFFYLLSLLPYYLIKRIRK